MLTTSRTQRPATFTNRQVANFYFRPCRDQYDEVILEYFRCRCGAVRKRSPGSRYTNLMQHIRREHPSFAAEMLAATPGETGSLLHYVRHSALNTFGWLEWIVLGNLPLSFCESRLSRRYTNLEPISVETLRGSLESVTRSVERAIAADLPERFDEAIRCPLLSMAPLVNEETDDLSAATHQAFLRTMLLRDYNKRLEQCVFLVGDNCSVNRRFATLMGVPLVGCASHRLNRAVAAELSEHAEDLDLVQTLMLKLRTLTQSAKLRLKTILRPIIRQQTRWGSTVAMLNRFFELLPFLDTDDDELAELLPSPAAKWRLKDLLGELKDVESVSKALQGSDVSLLDVRVWFDALIAKKESYSNYLYTNGDFVILIILAEIVHRPDFESGCVRVLKGQGQRLTRSEKSALEAFRVIPAAQAARVGDDAETGGSFVERFQKRRRLEQHQPAYELLGRIPPTSNLAERFFSVARNTFGLQRHSLQPYTLEMLLFLRQNEIFWDARTVENSQ
ncbi:hypothetical protein F443_19114 [Phytophthora nicotianae P1569]|uniref:HAT C-terminal dimerisation domain-containing protein n=2 Tax=Phytophthora nicotianae TaxID=4792 RepID=V9E762_PHYNI|nr:hypothetical protein F443_19114 [Phytophthora nicotianae P1569]